MQAYGTLFAEVYNQMWTDYANRIAPLIQAFYESTTIGKVNKKLLDVACGTGQLSAHFLNSGYHVVGLDLSESMLKIARRNALPFLVADQVKFVQGNAADFKIDETFGLVVSTYDSLNHLPDMNSLRGCFLSTYDVLENDGYFIFDLNTTTGLKNWNSLNINPGEEIFLFNRGIFDEYTSKAWTKITGFVRNEEGLYQRFDETVYNTVFEMEIVKESLLEVGFATVYFARGTSLSSAIEDPENHGKVFFIARK